MFQQAASRRTELPPGRYFSSCPPLKDYTAATVPLYEYRDEGSGRRFYSVKAPNPTLAYA